MDAQIDNILERGRRADGARSSGAARGARSRGAAHPRRRPAHGRARRGGDPRGQSGAPVAHDAALALDVIKGDAIINEAQRGVSRLISVTIATQQPVARDLRYLLTLDHVTYELERMGDHAASVAKAVIKLAPQPPLERLRPPARDGRAGRRPGPRRAARAGRRRTRSRRARSPSRTTRSTGSTTPPSTRSSS